MKSYFLSFFFFSPEYTCARCDLKLCTKVSSFIFRKIYNFLFLFITCIINIWFVLGKRGRKVPLLLTKNVEAGLNLLIECRDKVGVNPVNPFVFSVPSNGSVKNIRGPDAIRKHVRASSLSSPEAIYSINLRKHVATLSQLVNLTETELELLANFMGHDINIHREFYRLPEDTLQLAKCSKIMLLMEKGGIGKHSGKSLADIEVNLNGKILHIFIYFGRLLTNDYKYC